MSRVGLAMATIAITLGIIVGCSDDDAVTPHEVGDPLDQQYVFEYYFVNFAWGVVFNGKFIDGNGNVISYDHSHGYWNPANPDTLTAAELAEKFSVVTDTLGSIALGELNQAYRSIEGASEGELSERELIAIDAGTACYQCYKYDAEHGYYVRVLLAKSGGYRQFNLSTEAEDLLDWLDQVGWGSFDWLDGVGE